MKIRNGFVSNSSSTSFCIVGSYFEYNGDKDYDYYEKIAEMSKLYYHSDQLHEGMYIGKEINELEKRDIKLSDLKYEVKVNFDNCGLDSDKIRLITEGWYDG